MNDAELRQIDVTRARIINREKVDLGMIQAKIAALHKTVSDGSDAERDQISASTIEVMEKIVGDLDDLERKITSNYQSDPGAGGPKNSTNSRD
jgi:hypothetical protein